MRLAVVASHPIQYHAPLFRELARRLDLEVFFSHRATEADQAKAGFGVGFSWDVDLLSGYEHIFLRNVAARPGLEHFAGCDTPEIGSRLRAGRFDAVLVQGWHLKSFLQAGFAARRKGLPLLVRGDSHLGTPRSLVKKATKAIGYPALLRLFDAALYVGARSHAYWRHYHYPESRLFFSPHCVDNEWFAARATADARSALRTRLGIGPDTTALLFAGKLVPFKRPLDLVAAAGVLQSDGHKVAVLVAGAGPLEREMEETARSCGVSLHALGFCNQSQMPAVYAAADMLVLVSDGNETWGLVANEALACGKPVVLADTVGSAPDFAGDGTAGRAFPMGDIGALADALRDVMHNRPQASMIRAKSQAYSLEAAAHGITIALASRPSRLA